MLLRDKKRILILLLTALSGFTANANQELDRRYALQTVGFLRAWDNVDGLFADYVEKAYKNFFSKQSQYVLQDLARADKILEKSDLPYSKLLNDPEILRQIAKSFRSESLIRTKIIKEGPTYRFVLDWMIAPKMDLLATETFTTEDPTTLNQTLGDALQSLLRKIPFRGQVTGRDGEAATINIGAQGGVHKGDIIKVGTIDEVKVHPLLHSIVDWKINPTAKLTVTSVDEGLSFCKVTEEEPGRNVARYQKILEVLPGHSDPEPREAMGAQNDKMVIQKAPPQENIARLGWVAPALGFGLIGRQSGADSSSTTTGKTGDGFAGAAKADAELWLTGNWHLNAGLMAGLGFYSQKDLSTTSATTTNPASSVTATLSPLRMTGGYRFLPIPGLIASARAGFRSTSWTFPTVASERLGSVAVRSPTVSLGAEFVVRQEFGIQFNVDFGVFSWATESGFSSGGEVSGVSDAQAFFAVYHQIMPKIRLRLGFEALVNSVNFSNGATLSHNSMLLLPAVVFLF